MGRAAAAVAPQPGTSFAALGHQESWSQLAAIVRALRPPGAEALSDADLRSVVGWIPPRTVSRVQIALPPAAAIRGVYIDTFITPDDLVAGPTRLVLDKVRDAIRAAEREGARLATLGGFTSILLESEVLPVPAGIALTTGNTLTAALIIRGLERALDLRGRRLAEETLLIIGATGDIGSACARALVGRTRRLLLAARHRGRLARAVESLGALAPVEAPAELATALATATLIIAVASTPSASFALEDCRAGAIVCDAGYPKNLRATPGSGDRRVFWGGIGALAGGIRSDDGILERFYGFPVPDVAHGCILEGMVLALAGRYESYSRGRGNITPERVDEMWRLASRCGVALAPLFDGAGVWPEEGIA